MYDLIFFFLFTRTAHTQCVVLLVSTWPSVILSILCSVVVSLWLSTDIFKLQRNLVASYPILVQVSWSSLEISTFIVDRICQRESAECVGKQGATQNGRKGQRYSRRPKSAGAKKLPDCWAMGVVNLQLNVGGASTAWRSSKIKSRKFSQGLSAKILVLENF